ncbi:MAG: hypothetical protein R3C40_06315 [Parvularculaceae bacterium]
MTKESRPQLLVDISVKITSDAKGGYAFHYAGDFCKPNGDLDFSGGDARKKAIRIVFSIADGSLAGVKFQAKGDNAFWIAEKCKTGPDGCPQGPYCGDQFTGVTTLAKGAKLQLIDKNDDGKLYRYMLRFDLNGALVIHDPDNQNGGHD